MILYHGWVDDSLCTINDLLKLGFKEGIIHSTDQKALENCIAEEAVIERLQEAFPDCDLSTFTAVNEDTGKPLPYSDQKYC